MGGGLLTNSRAPHPLSREGRSASLSAMAKQPPELLIVGGGITGAGVARDAALRGMSVALLEQTDFGAGTSSRSSKIIHGGVRYLEYLELSLVRESARERRVLRRLAPHLVHPLPFLFPVFRGESLLKIRAGLKLFDLLAGSPRGEWSRHLSPEGTRSYLPGLRDPLKGSVLYPEYITDDARFTLANIASAVEHGARVANHARVLGFLTENGRVVGARVRDLEDDRELEIRAEITVNATGPWAEQTLVESGLSVPKPMVPSKGIHILFERERLPLQAATFLKSSSGRPGLAMPRGPWVYVGTSDEEYVDDLDRPRATAVEAEELLELTRDCFPELGLESGDVKATWAGIRPLIREDGKSTRDTSRHDEIWTSPPGLVTIAGGKLTTYRPMARRILKAVAAARGRPLPGVERTDRVLLPGAPNEELESFRDRMRVALSRRNVRGLTLDRIEYLYGTECEVLLDYGDEDPSWLLPLGPGVPALRGEVRLAVEREMALTLEDVLDRRLALLLFGPGGGLEGAAEAAEIAGSRLGWSSDRRARELASYRILVREHGPPGRIR